MTHETHIRTRSGVTETWNLEHLYGPYFAAYSARQRQDTRNQKRFTEMARRRVSEGMLKL